jgi:lysozyme
MPLHPRLSRAAIELVKAFETFNAVAQPLAGGGWTIGYGHTRTARDGAEVGREDGQALLVYDLNQAAEVVARALYAPASQRQFDALVAFCFNIGVENFRSSSALARFNAGATLEAADEIERWRHAELGAGAQVVDALVRRRAAEKAHFLGLPEGLSRSPSPVLRPLSGEAAPAPVAPEGPTTAEPSALVAAANGIQARLRELVPDVPPAPEPVPPAPTAEEEEEPEAPPFPVAEASPPAPSVAPSTPAPAVREERTDRLEPPAAQPEPQPLAAPYAPAPPAPPTHAAVEAANDVHAPPPPLVPEAPSPQKPVSAPAPVPTPDPAAAEPRPASPATGPAPAPRRAPFILAAVGAALVVIAAILILGGRVDLSSLLVGGLGALTLAAAIYGLLGPGRGGGAGP